MGGAEAIWGGSTTVYFLRRWALLDAVLAEFGAPTVTIALTWAWVLLLLVRGRNGFGWEREEGKKNYPW